MAIEAYRVLKPFQWRGWEFAPKSKSAGRPKANYAGDIWLVEAGHPRKVTMLENRFAVGDASIPAIDELMKQSQFKRLISMPATP